MTTPADRSATWVRRGAVLPAALLLSALASAPAFAAASGGTPVPGPVSGDQPAHRPGPVHQIVKTVSDAAGVPNPLEAEAPTGPTKHHRPVAGPVGRGWHPPRAERWAGAWVEPPAQPGRGDIVVPRGASGPSASAATGLRVVQPTLPASERGAAAVRAAVARLLGAGISTTARLIAVIAGMLALGFLAGAHIRSVQDRLATMS